MKMLLSEKTAGVFVSACFVIFLFAACLGTLLRDGQTYDYFENRNLAQMPTATAESVLSGTWSQGVEKYLADHCAGRQTLLKVNTLLDLRILKRPVVGGVVIGEDCLLPWNEYQAVSPAEIKAQAEALTKNVKSVSDLTESYGGQYYYVGVPCQYVFREDDYPWYMNNWEERTDLSLAALTNAFSAADIDFIDLGPVYAELGWADEYTSAIDNHYSMQGAYITYVEIMERINADTGYNLTVLREGDYEMQRVENPYLGSRNRKLLNLWRCDERLYKLIPKVDVPFARYDSGTVSPSTVYTYQENPWHDVLYSLYMGGDTPYTIIDTQRDELPSILVYGDSFTNACETVLWYGFDEMHAIDLRHYTQKTLGEVISELKPEIVICIRDYESILSTDFNGRGV